MRGKSPLEWPASTAALSLLFSSFVLVSTLYNTKRDMKNTVSIVSPSFSVELVHLFSASVRENLGLNSCFYRGPSHCSSPIYLNSSPLLELYLRELVPVS